LLNDGLEIISRALGYLEKVPLIDVERYANQYSEGYLALCHLIRDRTDPGCEQELLAAAYAVYGWMPTILKRFENLVQLSQFIVEVRGLPLNNAVPLIRDAAQSNRGGVLRSLNNSVVGTSKLLHFFRPDLFPIWDSRIAKLFGYVNGRHNNPVVYLAYFELLHEWREKCALPEVLCKTLQRGAPEDDPISQVRLREYCLFLASAIRYGFDLKEPE